MSQPYLMGPAANVPPTPHAKPHAKLQGVWLYLAILATVYVVASLVLGVVGYAAMQSNARAMQQDARQIEQLQTDTNDNLCNQQEYQGGTVCVGGDGNG